MKDGRLRRLLVGRRMITKNWVIALVIWAFVISTFHRWQEHQITNATNNEAGFEGIIAVLLFLLVWIMGTVFNLKWWYILVALVLAVGVTYWMNGL